MIAIAIIKIREALQEKVNGIVEVRVSHYDVLYISITAPQLSAWYWSISHITDQLHYGVTTDQIIEQCMKVYKRYIFTRFIKN